MLPGHTAAQESQAGGAQHGLGVLCQPAQATTAAAWGQTHASEGEASAAPYEGPSREPAGVLPGGPGGLLALTPGRERRGGRHAERRAGRQAFQAKTAGT